MITVFDHHGVVHAANGWDEPGHCLCGFPPYGTRLSDPAPQEWDMQGRDVVTCPRCLDVLNSAAGRNLHAGGQPVSEDPDGVRGL